MRVRAKSNEITAVPVLLAGRALQKSVITVDAHLTQRTIADQILAQGGHYLMVVKENQPELYATSPFCFNRRMCLPQRISMHVISSIRRGMDGSKRGDWSGAQR